MEEILLGHGNKVLDVDTLAFNKNCPSEKITAILETADGEKILVFHY